MASPYCPEILCPPAPCCRCVKGVWRVTDSCCVGTFSGGPCGGGGCGHGSVLLSAGRFAFQRSFLSLDAIGEISWNFSLDYLAGNHVDSILGKGFNYPQNLHLVSLSNGDVQWTSGENTLEFFLQTSPGVYVAAPTNNTRAELYRSGSGASDQFTLRASNGTVTHFFGFDPSIATPGRLQDITDRYGNAMSFVWQAAGTLDQLLSVTDSYGRTVNYSYFGREFGNRLQQIADFLGRQLNFQYDTFGHITAVVTPSTLNAAAGNTFPGGTACVFQYDVNNPRHERRDDLIKIWFPNEAAPFLDAATRTVNVAQVYQSATPRYVVEYGQDPTDEDLYGRVVRETVGDPLNGVGGTYEYLYSTQNLPYNFVDPSDPIVFRCILTDRNDNQTIYDFNLAQMPVRTEVIRSRAKIDIPSLATFPSYVTWTQYNQHNQPLLRILPEGNSVAYTYESGMIDLGSGPVLYNRRAGLLLSRTAYPGNPFSAGTPPNNIPAYLSASNGQSQLTELFFYEPIFNQPCATIERRGNPIDGSGDYFTPQNPPYSPTPPQTAQEFFAQRVGRAEIFNGEMK